MAVDIEIVNGGLARLDGEVSGDVSTVQSLEGEVFSTLPISGSVSPGSIAPRVPLYDGVYQVIPLPELDIILETANKRMLDDVVVKEIPYYQVSNQAGGYTVTIG